MRKINAFEYESIIRTAEVLGLAKELDIDISTSVGAMKLSDFYQSIDNGEIKVVAHCIKCGEELKYDKGLGWNRHVCWACAVYA